MDNLEQAMLESYKTVMAGRADDAPDDTEQDGITDQGPVGVADPVQDEAPLPSKTETRARDANGRFIDKDSAEAPEKVEPAKQAKVAGKPAATENTDQPQTNVATEPATAIQPPQSWSAQDKAAFAKAPPDVQAIIARREAEMHKGLSEQGTKYAEKARLADEIQNAAAPYAAMLQAEGATPATAFKSLLNTAYTLRAGTPAQRHGIIASLAKQFGVDLTAVASGDIPYEDPAIAQTHSRIQSLEQRLAQEQHAREEAATAQTLKQIEAFKTELDDKGNPKHPYFEEARTEMARLVQGGLAADVASAYEMAVWASPHLRAKQLADQSARAEADRVAAAKAKAVQATKSAGTRITSSDPQPEVKTTPRTSNDLEAEMRRNLQTIRNRG
jgi:hypothetical protein